MVIIEVFENGNPSEINGSGSWADAVFNLVKPASGETAPSTDYAKTLTFEGYPTSPLIDATTMEVVETDCYNRIGSCISSNL